MVVGINATNKRELVSDNRCNKMPRTHTLHVEDLKPPEIAKIQKRILEGGRMLAALIGKDFPIADNI